MAIYYGDSNGKAQRIVVTGMQGPAGPQGPQGEPGPQGPAGQGVPAGGTAGQVLVKKSGSDYDADWSGWELVHSGVHFNFYQLIDTIAIVAKDSEKIWSGSTEATSNAPFGGFIQNYVQNYETGIPSGLITNMPNIVASVDMSSTSFSALTFEEFLGSISMRYAYYASPGGSGFTFLQPGQCIAMYKK